MGGFILAQCADQQLLVGENGEFPNEAHDGTVAKRGAIKPVLKPTPNT